MKNKYDYIKFISSLFDNNERLMFKHCLLRSLREYKKSIEKDLEECESFRKPRLGTELNMIKILQDKLK